MAMDVVKGTVEYARSLEKTHDKVFRFTITTNGVLLDDETIDYVNREMSNVVLSLDGRQQVSSSRAWASFSYSSSTLPKSSSRMA